ncbi:hypothetical protein ACLB2K_076916 [Fragaria x ananassa]
MKRLGWNLGLRSQAAGLRSPTAGLRSPDFPRPPDSGHRIFPDRRIPVTGFSPVTRFSLRVSEREREREEQLRLTSSGGAATTTRPFTMGRMHSRGKGMSASALPYKRTPPSWLKISTQDVEESICKFAKKGLTPSQIGVILRDSHGIAQVKSVTGSKILRILKAHGLAPEIPEDLYHLIKKAVSIRKHLERNRKDKDSKFRLILVESRIHRLARYYKKTKKLPPVWRYESTTASTLVA